MDGYTVPPFRRFIKVVEPRAVVFSEFLPSTILAKSEKMADRAFVMHDDEAPVVIQLYGKDPHDFAVAAKMAEDRGAAGIDINMGCPAKKVVAHRHGSALMKEIDLAQEIVASIKAAVKVPVSVKTRLGWEDESKLIPFVLKLQEAGLDAITIHGRTYNQKFEGEARWEPIYALKEALEIPVFGNGDVTTASYASQKLGNLNGVMVGRGAVADPWLMQRICDSFADQPVRHFEFARKAPFWKKFAAMCVEHGDRDEAFAIRPLRKYLVKLHQGLGLDPGLRKKAVKVESLTDVETILDQFVESAVEELPRSA
jgi:tRNA-dihydrouridine synthase B